MATGEKAPGAFKTIGELSAELGVAHHILRYWETRFPQLRPLQRAGNRRYYRSQDVELARRINRLLNVEGYTVRGVQKLLRGKDGGGEPEGRPQAQSPPEETQRGAASREEPGIPIDRLVAIRDRLSAALRD